mgnify:CR=1 FL=1
MTWKEQMKPPKEVTCASIPKSVTKYLTTESGGHKFYFSNAKHIFDAVSEKEGKIELKIHCIWCGKKVTLEGEI